MELNETVATPSVEAGSPELEGEPDRPKRTLSDILTSMTAIEVLMDDPDFDVETVIGDINIDREELASKIDSIDYVIREFEAYAERTEARAKKMFARAISANRRAGELRNYLLHQMKALKFEKLSGNERYVVIKKHHTPRLTFARNAEPGDMIKYGDKLVRCLPAEYEWKSKEFWKAIKEEEIAPPDFLTLSYTEKVVFDDHDKPDVNEKKKGKKK